MRLRRLDLTRYGKFTDRTIDFGDAVDGKPDLHIVYGPNEAGKSTAFAGYLDLLFGMDVQSRYGFLHPYPTMRVGGCLELSVGARELVRIKRPNPTLRDAANAPVAEALILGDLAGIDRGAYRTMFSLDDDSLEAGGRSILDSKGQLGELLFSASSGLSELNNILLRLREEAEGFSKGRTRDTGLAQLKTKIVALKQERDALDTFAPAYAKLAVDRDAARAKFEAAQAERSQVVAALAQVQRNLAALPMMAARREMGTRLEPLADLPAPPPGWLAELPALQQSDNRHRSAVEQAEAEVKRLSDELDALVVDARALGLAGRLEPLVLLSARYRTAEKDLPDVQRQRAQADGEVAGILVRLGRADAAQPDRLLLTAAQSATLNGLIASRSGIEAKLTSARDEMAQAVQALDEAKHAPGATTGFDASALAPVTAALAALRASDHAIRLRAATQARALHGAAVAARLTALAPWQGSIEALAGLSLPDIASVTAWQATAQRDDTLIEQRRAEIERLETASLRRAAELDAIGRSAGLLGDREAADIRRARDAAWAEHRRALDAATADAFEAALRRDDDVGSARLRHERDLASLHETAKALAIEQAETARARALLDKAVARRREGADAFARAVAGLGPDAAAMASPAWLQDWIARREKALEARDQLLAAERDASRADADAAVLRDRLLAALGQIGITGDPHAGLEELAILAQEAVDGAQRVETQHKAVAECERAIRRREHALQGAAQLDKAWQAEWRAACTACWLGEAAASLPPEVMREVLVAVAALGPALKVRAGLAMRIGDMQDDQAAFARELDQLLPELGVELAIEPEIQPGQRPPLEVAQAVLDRVQAAAGADQRKRGLADRLAAARDRQRQVAADASLHARRVAEMMEHMQATSLIELAGRLRDAETKADLERQAAQAERDILAALQVGTLAAAETLLDAQEMSGLEIEQARLVAEREGLELRTRELFAEGGKAADLVEAVGGDDLVARLEERRRTTMLEIEDGALRTLRLRVGIAAADRALRAYRDQHRSAMMNQASDVFRSISRGAYRGLGTQPDRDGDILVALAADGASKLATDLSKGTRFQLYLALRAAGYREFARLRRPVPFIADDIMETFDDFRAEETLRVFAAMACVGQVIYLTHHDHLRAMAERTVPGVRVHALG